MFNQCSSIWHPGVVLTIILQVEEVEEEINLKVVEEEQGILLHEQMRTMAIRIWCIKWNNNDAFISTFSLLNKHNQSVGEQLMIDAIKIKIPL